MEIQYTELFKKSWNICQNGFCDQSPEVLDTFYRKKLKNEITLAPNSKVV